MNKKTIKLGYLLATFKAIGAIILVFGGLHPEMNPVIGAVLIVFGVVAAFDSLYEFYLNLVIMEKQSDEDGQ